MYNFAPHNPVATRCKMNNWLPRPRRRSNFPEQRWRNVPARIAHFYHSRSVTSVWAAAYGCVASALSARPPLALMNVKWERWRSLWLIGTCARPRALASANLHTHYSLSLCLSVVARLLHAVAVSVYWGCYEIACGVWELSVCMHKTFLAEMRACTLHKVTPLLAIPERTLSSSLCSYINMRAPVLLHVQREGSNYFAWLV